jgi:hypothetical protein
MLNESEILELAEELELDVQNPAAFVAYVTDYQWFPTARMTEEEIKAHYIEKLPEWLQNSEEYLVMEIEEDVHELDREANFVERYLEEYVTESIPTWVSIDYQGTWDGTLEYDFSICDRFVFSQH